MIARLRERLERSRHWPRTAKQRVGWTAALAAVLVASLVAIGPLVSSTLSALSMHWGWDRVIATIEHSDVEALEAGPFAYRFDVAYSYYYLGEDYESTRYARGYRGSSSPSAARQLEASYPVNSRAAAWVNPAAPGEAVLVLPAWHPSLLWLIPPLALFIVSFAGLWAIWFGGRSFSPGPARPGRLLTGGDIASMVTFGVLALVGAVAGWIMLFSPSLRLIAAQDWRPVDAVIEQSRIHTHADGVALRYRLGIEYSYRFGAVAYRSDRYHVLPNAVTSRRRMQEIVDAHPPGTEVTAYVNPGNPRVAVLDRRFLPQQFLGIIPVLLFAVGLAGLVYTFRAAQARRAKDLRSILSDYAARHAGGAWPDYLPHPVGRPREGPVTLRSARTPATKLVAAVVFALSWNGSIAPYVWLAMLSLKAGPVPWLFIATMIPFSIVGLAALGVMTYYLLEMRIPRVNLTLDADGLAMGDDMAVRWRARGALGGIQRLHIVLEAVERVFDRDGRLQAQATVTEIVVAEASKPEAMRAGEASITTPAHAMHSFRSKHHRLLWRLRVRAEGSRDTVFEESFGVVLLPGGAAEAREAAA